MKVQNTLMLLAKGSTVDNQDGSLSIFKIFTRFTFALTEEQRTHISENHSAEKPHMLPQQYVFVSSWMPEVKKGKQVEEETMNVIMELATEDPNGDEVAKQSINAELKLGEASFNININLSSVPITSEGVYEMTLRLVDPASNKQLGKAATSYMVTFAEPKRHP